MSNMRRWIVGLFLAAVSVTGFASTFVVGGQLTRECAVTPMAIVVIRFFFAGFLMLAWEMRSAERRRKMFVAPTKRDWLVFATVGPVGTSIMAWCVFAACARVGSANAAMSDALPPLLIFAFVAIRSKCITPWQVLGAVCGFVGALLVIGIVNADGLALSAYGVGDVFVFFAALTWAVYTVGAREPVKRLGAAPYTIWTMLFGALVCLPVLPFFNVAWPATVQAWGLMSYICVVPTVIAFWAWNAALKYIPLSTLAMTAYFTPVAAMAIGYAFFGERATAMQLLGTLFVCAAATVELKGSGK